VAGVAGDPSWPVYGYEISFAWKERVGIIMAVIAWYAAVNINGN